MRSTTLSLSREGAGKRGDAGAEAVKEAAAGVADAMECVCPEQSYPKKTDAHVSKQPGFIITIYASGCHALCVFLTSAAADLLLKSCETKNAKCCFAASRMVSFGFAHLSVQAMNLLFKQ